MGVSQTRGHSHEHDGRLLNHLGRALFPDRARRGTSHLATSTDNVTLRVTYRVGDYVVHDLYKDAIWQIAILGDEKFYSNGNQLSEDSSRLILYLPAPGVPRRAYPNQIWGESLVQPTNCS